MIYHLYKNNKGDSYYKTLAGNFHNPHGPAIIYRNGKTSYYLDGYIYDKTEWETKRQYFIIQENLNKLLIK